MDIDLNLLRSAVTVISLSVFLCIVAWAWAWSSGQRERFDEAARAPLMDDEAPRHPELP